MAEIKSIRMGLETQAKIDELGRIWGPVKPLTLADVVRECVERIYKQEAKKQEKRR